jgi:predicted membrane protein
MERRAIVPAAHLVVGILIIAAGVLFTLDNLNLIEARDYLRFWPVALIALGAAKFLDAVTGQGRFAGIFLMLFGALLLLDNLAVVHFRIRDYWPLLLIALGIVILWRAFGHAHRSSDAARDSIDSTLAVLGGVNKVFRTQDFQGGELTALLGGCEVDLRTCGMQVDQAVLNVFAFFGGIEIKVPEDWIVVNQVVAVLGGNEDKTVSRAGAQKRLIIRGSAILGGIEIHN